MNDRVQMTLIRIDDYGPWTLKLGSDREYRLQILQSNLHAKLQELFSKKGGAVFFNRFDEIVAISNCISLENHIEIHEELAEIFPFTVSMGIGIDRNPSDALSIASNALKKFTDNGDIKNMIATGELIKSYKYRVKIAHIDVDEMTKKFTYQLSAYESAMMINKLNTKLSELFFDNKALTFFCGGDNFMVVANGVEESKIENILNLASDGMDLQLKAGIGEARTGRKAIELATKGLDMIRSCEAKSPIHKIIDTSL